LEPSRTRFCQSPLCRRLIPNDHSDHAVSRRESRDDGEQSTRTRAFTIYDNSQLFSAAQWNNAIIAYRNGAPVRVRDVGRAVNAAENIRLAAYANGKPAILLPITRVPGANVIATWTGSRRRCRLCKRRYRLRCTSRS
jgi:multidrug efflux pump subunit AcrB